MTDRTESAVSVEQRLRESEARLRLLTEASSDVLYRMSPDWGEMKELNGGGFLPSTPSSKPNRSWLLAYIPETDQAAVTAAIDDAIRLKKTFDLEHRVVRTDGTVGWTLSRAVPLLSAEGEIVEWFGAASDIGARRDAEAALHESEAKLRKLNATLEQQVDERTAERDRMWDTSPDLLAVIDFDGMFHRVNPAWTTVLGYIPDELIGHHVNEFVVPDDHGKTVDAYETAATGNQLKIENRYLHKDGSTRTISWVAAPAGHIAYATGRDVTAERDMESRLHDEQDFARLALSAVGGVGVWTYDVTADCFYCDEAISALYALDPERGAAGLTSEEFLAHVHPQDRLTLQETMSGGLQRPEDLELEYRLVHPDGSIRWVLSRGHTHFDESGKPVRRTGVGVDMTGQRQIEDQLRQAQKMEAVGQLTGGLAHDFNNLLTGMMGNLELLQMRLQRGKLDDAERFIHAAQGAGRRAASLTQRLLAFSRRQTLDPKPTDVNRLIVGMEDLLSRTVGSTADIEVAGAAELWPAMIDATQLESAILNLCINARDAMPDGGRITTAWRWSATCRPVNICRSA
jgi:PAS domain S-box-containing protein